MFEIVMLRAMLSLKYRISFLSSWVEQEPELPSKFRFRLQLHLKQGSYILRLYAKLETPVPLRTLKLSNLGHGQHLDGYSEVRRGYCSCEYCKIPEALQYMLLGPKKKSSSVRKVQFFSPCELDAGPGFNLNK